MLNCRPRKSSGLLVRWRFRDVGKRDGFVCFEEKGSDAGAALLIGAEVRQDLLGDFRSSCQDELQVMAERGFDRGDVLVGDANLVGQGAEDLIFLAERGERSRSETFVLGLQLFQDVEPRSFLSLLSQEPVQLVRGPVNLVRQLAQPALPLLDAPAAGLGAELLGFHVRRKLLEPDLQMGPLLLELDLLGGQFFHAHDIALFLEVQGIDLISGTRKLLGGAESLRLGLA